MKLNLDLNKLLRIPLILFTNKDYDSFVTHIKYRVHQYKIVINLKMIAIQV
jgi:hypothetical protein